jgi:hypothetical protein
VPKLKAESSELEGTRRDSGLVTIAGFETTSNLCGPIDELAMTSD